MIGFFLTVITMAKFWAICARVNETKIRKFEASSLVALDIRQKFYWPFNPEEGFKKKGKYGQIVTDKIYVYNVLKLTGK